ncbi:hypothetical protein [Actinoplanes awajinensis]|uniref:Uncharacterized protein n=1 Tax=Actinoplanes awajinensis subsp. mycoplanecinus TaxID=135947 RepID=A0A0X3UQW0_9ACTN|nr:hypothetical protein [Actinoplanes awajinensis]KUL34517.1 hypothetical protein ADL15_15685 [Actinoplanes awajinensis subsp. mycoplanecinus]
MTSALRRNAAVLVLAALAAGCAAIIWFVMPHDREVKSLGIFLFKLLPFVFATEALARLDVAFFRKYQLVRVLVPASFVVFFLYFVPKIFFYAEDHPTLYYHVLVLTPLIILSLTMAYRLGGGTPGNTRRIAAAMLLIMVSGAEDLAYLTVNNHTDPEWATIPETWTWASHIKVFLGHYPSKMEAYVFIAVHVVLALFVLAAPTRWFERLNPWRGRGAQPVTPAPADSSSVAAKV